MSEKEENSDLQRRYRRGKREAEGNRDRDDEEPTDEAPKSMPRASEDVLQKETFLRIRRPAPKPSSSDGGSSESGPDHGSNPFSSLASKGPPVPSTGSGNTSFGFGKSAGSFGAPGGFGSSGGFAKASFGGEGGSGFSQFSKPQANKTDSGSTPTSFSFGAKPLLESSVSKTEPSTSPPVFAFGASVGAKELEAHSTMQDNKTPSASAATTSATAQPSKPFSFSFGSAPKQSTDFSKFSTAISSFGASSVSSKEKKDDDKDANPEDEVRIPTPSAAAPPSNALAASSVRPNSGRDSEVDVEHIVTCVSSRILRFDPTAESGEPKWKEKGSGELELVKFKGKPYIVMYNGAGLITVQIPINDFFKITSAEKMQVMFRCLETAETGEERPLVAMYAAKCGESKAKELAEALSKLTPKKE